MVHHHNEEYLATALHVARVYNFQPLTRRSGAWQQARWETVATKDDADVATLETSSGKHSRLTPKCGLGHVLIGRIGRAMGFAAITDVTEISHVAEIEGIPVPLTALRRVVIQI